jgi:hypothetical protein
VKQRDYDSTVARIAGNILGHLLGTNGHMLDAVEQAVELARAIVDEVKRTEPKAGEGE